MCEYPVRLRRGSLFARGDATRVDLGTLFGVISTLTRLTGQPVTPNDLLEVIEEPEQNPARDVEANLQDASRALQAAEATVSPEELDVWLEATRNAVKPLEGSRVQA